jgi:hypothetical protein
MPMEVRAPPDYYYYYYYHHLIRTTPTTTTNNNNNNNKIIINLILTKSFVNIIIFTYNTVPCTKEILWKYLTVLRSSKMFFVLKFELILIIGSNNVLTEGARKVHRGRRVGQGCSRPSQCRNDFSEGVELNLLILIAISWFRDFLHHTLPYFPRPSLPDKATKHLLHTRKTLEEVNLLRNFSPKP